MALHSRETERIEFPDGDWIDIRKKVTVGARKEALNRATRGTFNAEGQVGGTFLTGEFKIGLLYKMIVAWSSPEPVTEQAIDDLPEEVSERLLAEIDRLNPTRTEEQKAPLEINSTESSESQPDSGASEPTPIGQESLATSQ